MTCEEYEESVRFVEEATARFHKSTLKYPTKEEAVKALRNGRRETFFAPKPHWRGDRVIYERCCERLAALELIQRIHESPEEDPIKVAYQFLDFMDNMMVNSESRHTWAFAGTMEKAIHVIIHELLG
jgi:hypothetical protein